MVKRFYLSDKYLESWVATPKNCDDDFFMLTESKIIAPLGEYHFSVKTTLKKLHGLYFLSAAAPICPLVNENVKSLLMKECVDDIQFIPAIVHCKDGISSNYFVMNTLHEENIIDIENSKKIYLDKERTDFFLDIDNLVIYQNVLRKNKIGRNIGDGSTVLFWANDLVEKIEREKFNKYVSFK